MAKPGNKNEHRDNWDQQPNCIEKCTHERTDTFFHHHSSSKGPKVVCNSSQEGNVRAPLDGTGKQFTSVLKPLCSANEVVHLQEVLRRKKSCHGHRKNHSCGARSHRAERNPFFRAFPHVLPKQVSKWEGFVYKPNFLRSFGRLKVLQVNLGLVKRACQIGVNMLCRIIHSSQDRVEKID